MEEAALHTEALIAQVTELATRLRDAFEGHPRRTDNRRAQYVESVMAETDPNDPVSLEHTVAALTAFVLNIDSDVQFRHLHKITQSMCLSGMGHLICNLVPDAVEARSLLLSKMEHLRGDSIWRHLLKSRPDEILPLAKLMLERDISDVDEAITIFDSTNRVLLEGAL